MLRLRSILSRCTVTNSCPVAYTVRYLHSSRHWRCPPHTSAPEAMAMPCHFRLFFCRTLIVQTAPSLVRIEKLSSSDSGIVDLKLERAEAKNAISKEMLKGLQNAIVEIDRDSSAKVVLVSSSIPRVFCAGADLKERRLMNTSEVEHFVNSLRSTFSSLEALSVPTIAVIEGAALGGGLEMALSCDLRICGEDAVFCMPETGLAIIPGAGGTQRLPRIVGRSLAKELIYTARRFGGREALTMGLANYCVQAGEAYSKALQIARDINEKGPLAIKMAKKAIDEGMLQGDLSSAMSVERECYEKLLYSQDRLEGLAAFAEKRKPIYAGK
ncbi:probable enoyl-CoA hydratase 2, mitochondrial isoform X1 [Phalaenopsis equestris]|uniref:probable enoyl-CoA hydratase 2, mitochondrial isoform X1 n=1 Tax=Phalaenopsis equestris TaxID=78828 RepID=UPI0009E41DFF|nr:probable enoyl-CoA hydratase 2, mitochondrial isoform X1 [Phalaenopsis equestris]